METNETNIIDEKLNNAWRNFVNWKNESHTYQTLEMPQDIAEVFIPKRILKLSRNPLDVKVLLTASGSSRLGESSLGILIYEHLSFPITDYLIFYAWYKRIHERVRKLPRSQSESPSAIDYKHNYYADLIQKRILTLNDYIYIQYTADVIKDYPNIVMTRIYSDRSELHGMGVATSFYEDLEKILKELGFSYLAGDVNRNNMSFFLKRRELYENLPDDVKSQFPPSFKDPNHIYAIRTL